MAIFVPPWRRRGVGCTMGWSEKIRQRPPGRGPVLLRYPVPGIGIYQRISDAFHICGRSLSIPGKHWYAGPDLWGAGISPEKRETLWRDTLAKNPESWLAHNNLGAHLIAEGHLDEAMPHLNEAIRLYPANPETHGNLGEVHYRTGNFEQAAAAYFKAVELAPQIERYHLNLANTYARMGKVELAAMYFRNASILAPENPSHHNHAGIALYLSYRLDEAREHFKKALRRQPAYFNARLNLGTTCYRLGLFSQAEQHYKQALAINPAAAVTYGHLGLMYQSKGDYAAAAAYFSEMTNRDAQYDFEVPAWGTALEVSPEIHAAVDLYKMALARKTDPADAQLALQKALSGHN